MKQPDSEARRIYLYLELSGSGITNSGCMVWKGAGNSAQQTLPICFAYFFTAYVDVPVWKGRNGVYINGLVHKLGKWASPYILPFLQSQKVSEDYG